MKKLGLLVLFGATALVASCTATLKNVPTSKVNVSDNESNPITKLNVTFDFNGGTYDSKTTITFNDVKPTTYFRYVTDRLTGTITPPRHYEELIGYSFSRGETDYLILDDYVIREDITVYAQYGTSVQHCVVQWLDEDGSTVLDKGSYLLDETPEFKGTLPSHEGKTFVGWDPEIHPITQQEFEAGYVIYKAVYKAPLYHSIVLDYNDGSTSEEHTQRVLHGECLVKPKISKAGYTLKEWRYVNGGTFDFNTPITEDGIKIEAIWELNKYAVAWLNYDGTPLEAKTKEYGDGDVPNYDGDILPTRESDASNNYIFAGWLPTPDKIYSDMTYIATYDAIPYDTQACLKVNMTGGQTFKFSYNVQSEMPAINIDWGDGNTTTGDSPASHTYNNSGSYTIRVYGYISNIKVDGSSKDFVESIYLGRTITSIADDAFNGCVNLKSVNIAENSSLTEIEGSTFYDCSNLVSINIPSSVTSIGDSAFCGCSKLKSVTITKNSSLTSIGEYTFQGCSSLTSIAIPSGVSLIDVWAFTGCSNLKSVTFAENSSLTAIKDGTFDNCSSLTTITIPNKVTLIDIWAFQSCTGLVSIIIPSSVTEIGYQVFLGCSQLKSVDLTAYTIDSTIPPYNDSIFEECSSELKFHVASETMKGKFVEKGWPEAQIVIDE